MDPELYLVYYGEDDDLSPQAIFRSRDDLLEVWQSARAFNADLTKDYTLVGFEDLLPDGDRQRVEKARLDQPVPGSIKSSLQVPSIPRHKSVEEFTPSVLAAVSSPSLEPLSHPVVYPSSPHACSGFQAESYFYKKQRKQRSIRARPERAKMVLGRDVGMDMF
jgi:hypothetical protein